MFPGNVFASSAVDHKSPYPNVAKSDLRGDSEDWDYWSLKTMSFYIINMSRRMQKINDNINNMNRCSFLLIEM